MAKIKAIDRLQFAAVSLTQAAADTALAVQFDTRIGVEELKGIEISRVQYMVQNPYAVFQNPDTGLVIGLGQIAVNIPNPAWTTASAIWPTGTLDVAHIRATEDIHIAGDTKVLQDIVHDFGDNTLVCHPASLYAMLQTDNGGAAAICSCIIGYRYIDLDEAAYRDIMQGYILQNKI